MDVSPTETKQNIVFLTLTLRKQYSKYDSRMLVYKILLRLIRSFNEMFGEWHLVVEPTQHGMPHFHAIADVINYTKYYIFNSDYTYKYGFIQAKPVAVADINKVISYLHKEDTEKSSKLHKVAFLEYFNELFNTNKTDEDINRQNYKQYRTFLRKWKLPVAQITKNIFDYLPL